MLTPGSDLTMAMEAHIIDLEKECSIQAVSRLTGLSWDRCWGVMDRSVRRGQRRKAWKVPVYIGAVDHPARRGERRTHRRRTVRRRVGKPRKPWRAG